MNRTIVGLLGLAAGLHVTAGRCRAQTVAETPPADPSVRGADTLLARRVSVTLDGVSRSRALDAVAARAKVVLQYRAELVDADEQTVSLHLVNVPLSAAVERVLDGTRFQLVVLPGPRLTVIRNEEALRTGLTGGVVGKVTDARTNKPIAGASVSVKDTKQSVVTHDDGTFRLLGVQSGLQAIVVRRIGYSLSTKMIRVADDATDTLNVALVATPTALTEVVTTATGDRQRLEVGNAVGTIKADSIVPTTLIRNVSDLLQARVPGVVVTNTDGAVGAPSKIRLRGVNSINLNNDPIIIVDGIRLNSQATVANLQTNLGSAQMQPQLSSTANPNGTPNAVLEPSRLDDIDPNTIESIDVLRGPSASSLYGTDAANGVIVIKTKRGQPGAWRTSITGDDGRSWMPGKLADWWFGWGRQAGSLSSVNCSLAYGYRTVAGGGCFQDSVTHFNPENVPAMQTLGTGTNRSLSANVSGGTESLQQFLSARLTSDVGMAKMSDAEQRLIGRLWSTAPPSWMLHPNTEQDIDGSSRTTFNIKSKADVSVTSEGFYRNVLNDGNGLYPSTGVYTSAADTLSYLPSEDQRTEVTSAVKRGTLGLNANVRPFAWLSFSGTTGGDYSLRTDQSDLQAQYCTVAIQLAAYNSAICPSGHLVTRGETFVTTANGSANLSFTPLSWLNLRTSLGEQYSHTRFYSMGAGNSSPTNCPLAFGSTLLSPNPVCSDDYSQQYTVTENQDEAATAGIFVEETINAFGLYTTFGVRRDLASAFGGLVKRSPPNYPKFNFSYPLSDQSFFPKQPYISSLRLRLAYGQSGNQASQTAVLNNYSQTNITFGNGSLSTPSLSVTAIGNAQLRPEIGTEWEGGFDVGFFESQRLTLEFTLYHKYTRDAIATTTLAPSLNNYIQFYNLGDVENRGLELSVTAKLFDTRAIAWDLTVNGSANSNKLVHKAPGLSVSGPLNTQFREGYPLYGYWGLPVASYADVNRDSILDPNEIVFGSVEYMGAPYPKGELTYNSTLSLWNGALRLGTTIDQIVGQTTALQVAQPGNGGFLPRGAVDRTAPLGQQAAYVQAAMNNNAYIGTSSSIRVNELSATYTVPARLARRLYAQSLSITVAGRNVALWSSYVGKDPDVDTSGLFGEATQDNGLGTPQPRSWTLRFNLGL